MFSLRSRALISAAAFFAAIGLMAAVIFLGDHPDEKVVSDLHRDPIAFALGWSMLGATVAIVVFVVLSLTAWLSRRWPTRSSDGVILQLYSPNQVFCASALGGPLAATSLFKANYLTLQNLRAASKAVVVGWTFFLVLMAALITLTHRGFTLKGLGTGIGVGYSVAAQSLMARLQLTKKGILESDQYSFRPNWHVVGVGVLYLGASLVIFFATAFGLVIAGYHLPQ